MRTVLTGEQFGHELERVQRCAWRWEQQPVYDIGFERAKLQAFLDGRPEAPDGNPDMEAWMRIVHRLVQQEGKRVSRVRVYDEPATDYQRWLGWMDEWNRAAGEEIDYLPRSAADRLHLPGWSRGADWWLIDDSRLLLIRFDDRGAPLRYELVIDEPEVIEARIFRAQVIEAVATYRVRRAA